MSESKTFSIRFGTAMAVDQFGFVRSGTIAVSDSRVEVAGPKHWSVSARVGVFLAITVLPLVLFGFGVGFVLALVVIHYFCTSPGSIQWNKTDLELVTRVGHKISFLVLDQKSGKRRKFLFRAANEKTAAELEELLAAQSRTTASDWFRKL